MAYVYVTSEPGLYTVGFYDPAGKWQPESDHDNQGEAVERVAFLNGNPAPGYLGIARTALLAVEQALKGNNAVLLRARPDLRSAVATALNLIGRKT
jgi:hypothetical protein